jgi:Icc-related predicted phosphoesterase
MKLVAISDLHGKVHHVDALRAACAGAGALFICGDFTTFGDQPRIQSVADAVRVEGVPCFFVTGNCDAMPCDGSLAGCQNLHGRVAAFGDWLLAGLSGSLPCPSHTPNEFEEDFYARLLSHVKEACGNRTDRLVLVTHQPPFDTAADLVPGGRHVGSRALRNFIDKVQPACCLSGHIHEAASRSRVGRTLLLNPGPFSQGHIATFEL